MAPTPGKAELRRQAIAARAKRDPAVRAALDRKLCDAIIASPYFTASNTVLLYAPVRGEIDVRAVARAARLAGKVIGFPRSRPGGQMTFHAVTCVEDLLPDLYGIPAPLPDAPIVIPDSETLLLVPGVCYDRDGYRIGYGGGYYDRFLSDFQGISVGITYEGDLLPSLPSEPHDRPVRLLATECGIHQTRNPL